MQMESKCLINAHDLQREISRQVTPKFSVGSIPTLPHVTPFKNNMCLPQTQDNSEISASCLHPLKPERKYDKQLLKHF